MPSNAQSISVDSVFLDLRNPRHKPYTSEAEVISYLCKNESVYALAKDMARIGGNPLELLALVPADSRKTARRSGPFVVAEGNRRICAIKLLNDPDLAPANLRADFQKISDSSTHSFTHVFGIIFDDKNPEEKAQLDAWLERIHGGPQAGIGRRSWSPEQKTRHLGDRKNSLAQSVLDYAEKQRFITPEQRKGKLTTAQRYLGNPFLREAIGIDSANSEDVSRNRPPEEFDVALKKFMVDLIDNTVSSRSDSEDIKTYARTLSALPGLSNKRIAGESLVLPGGRRIRRKPKEPVKPKTVKYEPEVQEALQKIQSYKLEKLYYSICEVALDKHTPLVSVGVWSFLETLTARCGRNSSTPFASFLGHQKLTALGFTDKDRRKTMIQAIERIAQCGNTTKHHDKSANFNGEQLANDMDVLKEMLVKLISEVKP